MPEMQWLGVHVARKSKFWKDGAQHSDVGVCDPRVKYFASREVVCKPRPTLPTLGDADATRAQARQPSPPSIAPYESCETTALERLAMPRIQKRRAWTSSDSELARINWTWAGQMAVEKNSAAQNVSTTTRQLWAQPKLRHEHMIASSEAIAVKCAPRLSTHQPAKPSFPRPAATFIAAVSFPASATSTWSDVCTAGRSA